ncbi:MAG: hypothetical protein P8L37_02575 [Phycisphaerales bacterium]|nr:hypothetical protein [Phycisphaerales bacterium]
MKPMNILLCSGCVAALTNGALAGIWLNELHYDNEGGDVDEGVEIAADFIMNPDLLEVYAYNGSSSQLNVYNSWDSTDFNFAEVDGGSLLWFVGQGSLQNGAPDGLAIVYDGLVVQFISYEGSPFIAGSGPAEGMTSEDLGIFESGSTAVGTSLQLTGTGQEYSDFSWTGGEESTWGSLNEGQTIGLIPAPGVLAMLGLAGFASRRRRRH